MNVAKISSIKDPREYHISNALFALPKTFQDKISFQTYIKKHNIDTLINVSDYPISGVLRDFYKRAGLTIVIYAPFQDNILAPNEFPKLLNHLKEIYKLSLSSGNTLVHCTAGINRSATVIAYICNRTSGLDMGYVIQKIKESNRDQRNIDTLTNYSFENLLRNHI